MFGLTIVTSVGGNFALRADLERHKNSLHSSGLVPGFQCKWSECTQRPYKRPDQLRRHIRSQHETSIGPGAKKLSMESEASYEQSVKDQRLQLNSSLLCASKSGNLSMVRLLVSQGSDINMQSEIGHTALRIAVERSDSDLVRLLLDLAADLNISFRLNAGMTEFQDPLIINGYEIFDKRKPFFKVMDIASYKGNLSIVQLLVEKGEYIEPALCWASLKGREDIVQGLLHTWNNLQHSDNSHSMALIVASYLGHTGIIRMLLDAGVNVNSQSEAKCYAIQAAASKGHLEATDLLLSRGADVDVWTPKAVTALQIAAEKGYEKLADLLLQRGADVNKMIPDNSFEHTETNALCIASEHGHMEMVTLLINHGAKVNVRAGYWGSPLLAASARNFLGVVQTLLERGADPNLENAIHLRWPTFRDLV